MWVASPHSILHIWKYLKLCILTRNKGVSNEETQVEGAEGRSHCRVTIQPSMTPHGHPTLTFDEREGRGAPIRVSHCATLPRQQHWSRDHSFCLTAFACSVLLSNQFNLLGSRSFPLPFRQNFVVKRDVRIPWDSYFIYRETWILSWDKQKSEVLDIKGNFSNSQITWPQSVIYRLYVFKIKFQSYGC